MADSGQIEQILMNLAVNARDAMPNGGSLIIETKEVFLDNAFTIRREGLKPGSYIMLAVTDTGEGMTQEVQKKIFEPFFTTKKLGKGTGLGLATIFGIVKQHNGYIYVYSEPGSGSTFRIYFPLADEAKEESSWKKQMSMPHGRERILVVDDAPSICMLVTDALQPLGYQVLEAHSAKDAIEIARSKEEKIDLLLTDVIMPEMNGKELADELKESRPDMKVIFMSGYTNNVILQERIMESGLMLINKPLIPNVLARKLREVLDK
jgi:two-component system cell cycle sensor histidine kinase/response regulator CckA